MKYIKLKILLACAVSLLLASCGGTETSSIGGTVTGLSSNSQLVLQDNGGDNLTVSANGSFTFATQISAGSTYDVTILTQPVVSTGASAGLSAGETCVLENYVGVVEQSIGNVNSIAVNCVATVSANNDVQGTVTNLTAGKSVTLVNNGTDTITVYGTSSGTVNFVFPTPLKVGETYDVVVSGASGTSCTVANNIGTIPNSGTITAVAVTCS